MKTVGDSVLKKVAPKVENIDEEIQELSLNMIETMKAARGIGLAAPQVGISLRMVVVDMGYMEYDKLVSEGKEPEEAEVIPVVMINPEIIEREGHYEMEEGCLSVPGYRALIERAGNIRYRYTDLEGKTVEREAVDLEAVCVQHEIDHLDGTLFIDKVSRIKRRTALKKVEKYLANIKNYEEDSFEHRLYG